MQVSRKRTDSSSIRKAVASEPSLFFLLAVGKDMNAHIAGQTLTILRSLGQNSALGQLGRPKSDLDSRPTFSIRGLGLRVTTSKGTLRNIRRVSAALRFGPLPVLVLFSIPGAT